MKDERANGSMGTGAVMTGRRVLTAEAVVLGGLALALVVREFPSLVREARIWRMAGGFRAGRRYP